MIEEVINSVLESHVSNTPAVFALALRCTDSLLSVGLETISYQELFPMVKNSRRLSVNFSNILRAAFSITICVFLVKAVRKMLVKLT